MPTVVIRLDPQLLDNPDTDLRYEVPDCLEARSGGRVRANGYDYEENDVMALYFDVDDAEDAMALIGMVLKSERFMGNDLSGLAAVTVEADPS